MIGIGITELFILAALFGVFVLPLVGLVVFVLVRGKKKEE